MRWHNSRYPCNEPNCGKVFTRENDLRRHSTIHKGERKYACPKCGKPFNRKDAMERHRRT
ncbi:hypothetical protein PUNSTDRAFT_67673, partial [Punctularia strigosozonata HHB-11173 SS5]|uniref:uncharacterized protein n=1 Tax=Punctularia strigosozonata (strain HHB-11173) TaxID=741275 RepID=UPI00044184EA